MLAVCDKMCNAIDNICDDTSEHKHATASVAFNTMLFANTGSALGVVADKLDEILAVCHETCNAIDSICVEIEAIDDDDGAEHEFANAITSEKLLCPKRCPYKHVRRCRYGAPECPGQCSLNRHTIRRMPFHVLH